MTAENLKTDSDARLVNANLAQNLNLNLKRVFKEAKSSPCLDNEAIGAVDEAWRKYSFAQPQVNCHISESTRALAR